jgi:hypothetical protein
MQTYTACWNSGSFLCASLSSDGAGTEGDEGENKLHVDWLVDLSFVGVGIVVMMED